MSVSYLGQMDMYELSPTFFLYTKSFEPLNRLYQDKWLAGTEPRQMSGSGPETPGHVILDCSQQPI